MHLKLNHPASRWIIGGRVSAVTVEYCYIVGERPATTAGATDDACANERDTGASSPRPLNLQLLIQILPLFIMVAYAMMTFRLGLFACLFITDVWFKLFIFIIIF